MTKLKNWKGVFYGIAYGLVSRAIFALEDFSNGSVNALLPTFGLMTISFMFLVPFATGLLAAYHHDTVTSSRKVASISMPVFAVAGLIGISVLSGKEGIICALMALPVFLFMSLLGGYIGVRIFKRNKGDLSVSLLVLLPFLFAPLENQFVLADKIFTEHTTIAIEANEQDVWNNITRVKEISEQENNYSFFQLMGFPRPIKAELDTVAVGGMRKAVFARGLFFTETVTQVELLKTLAFNIEADPASIPPQALDQHVMVGGTYFDVLEGKYEIEKISNHKIRLHLTSQFRLSTPFNFYTGVWSKILMKDIQQNILEIIRQRSEAQQSS
ncbi:hypothetical protein FEM33_10635 [Dyadobacter flavalbus]|uniref:SRPBCC family protein n=1 Tax=Dyadobacter flavalbus TaxID=2579942 RepID=A0A5M8QWU4_9BACT|nr:hypothetical protein [Dyadobacter flavalbus]KAA6439808.1 hypothetical protein FEM33_10635 [Dyadobacter flavalbus]